MTDERCPRCGTINAIGSLFCENRSCRAYLAHVPVRPKTVMRSEAQTSPTEGRYPAHDVQDLTSRKCPSTAFSARGSGADGVWPSKIWTRRIVIGGLGVATAFGLGVGSFTAGWASSWSQVHAALAQLPRHTSTTAVSRPVNKHAQVSKTTVPHLETVKPAAVVHARTVTPASGSVTLTGTIQHGQILLKVWVASSPSGPLYPVDAILDTGAETPMVSGRLWSAMGDRPNGTTAFAGVGGSETVNTWPNIYVYPQDTPTQALIAGATIGGGLGRLPALAQEGVSVLLGQSWLQHATLTERGNTWTLTYDPQP